MSVSLSARMYEKCDTSKLHEIFCTCYLWPWLIPLTMDYGMHFQFCG